MNLIQIILNNLMALLPFVVLKGFERGVRWSRFGGGEPVELLPGLRRKLWFFDQVEVSEVLTEFIELPLQTVMTADGHTVCFSANIGFYVDNIVAYWTGVQNVLEAVKAAAMVHLAERVRKSDFADLRAADGIKKLEDSLQGTMTTRLKGWGIKVTTVGFTNFTEVAPPLRVFVDAPLVPLAAPLPAQGTP